MERKHRVKQITSFNLRLNTTSERTTKEVSDWKEWSLSSTIEKEAAEMKQKDENDGALVGVINDETKSIELPAIASTSKTSQQDVMSFELLVCKKEKEQYETCDKTASEVVDQVDVLCTGDQPNISLESSNESTNEEEGFKAKGLGSAKMDIEENTGHMQIEKFLKDFIKDRNIEIDVGEEKKIYVRLRRNPDDCEDELRRLQQKSSVKIRQEVLAPVYKSYLNAELQRDFISEIEKVLTMKFQISHESFHICERLHSTVSKKEFLPNIFFLMQDTDIVCYFLPSAGVKMSLHKIIVLKLDLDFGECNFFANFIELNNIKVLFKKKNAGYTFALNETEQRLDVVGRVVDVCYVKAWVNHIRQSLKKLVIDTSGWTVDLYEAADLVKLFLRIMTRSSDKFFVKIENKHLGYIVAIDNDDLKAAEDRLKLLWPTYVSVLVPAEPVLMRYFKKFTYPIKDTFAFVHFEVVNNETGIKIQGDAITVQRFQEFAKTIVLQSFRTNFDIAPRLNIKCVDVIAVSFGLVTLEGEQSLVSYVDKMLFYSSEQKPLDYVYNSTYKEHEKTIIPLLENDTMMKCLFELDYQQNSILKSLFKKLNKDCTVEWSAVTNQITVYTPANHLIQPEVGYSFILNHIQKMHTEQHIKLGLGNVVKENVALYEKLIHKLQNLRFSLELKWGITISVRFEMLEFDVLRIIADKHVKDALLQALMERQRDKNINFQTSFLVNGEFLNRLVNASIGKTWEIKMKRGSVVFTGPYLYYLFFNILFEEHLFSGNYTLSEYMYEVAGFEEYAKVFQRSPKLLRGFKESLNDDIKNCRCEMRAFADEFIIQPTLHYIKRQSSVNLKEKYNKAFAVYTKKTLKKKTIKIVYGVHLQNDTVFNFLKHFVSVLNAEVRLMERKILEPFSAIVDDKLDSECNVVITGINKDAYFIASKLAEPYCTFQRVQVDNHREEPIEDVYKLFQEYKDNKYETRFIDFLFFRTYFDIRDNRLDQRVDSGAIAVKTDACDDKPQASIQEDECWSDRTDYLDMASQTSYMIASTNDEQEVEESCDVVIDETENTDKQHARNSSSSDINLPTIHKLSESKYSTLDDDIRNATLELKPEVGSSYDCKEAGVVTYVKNDICYMEKPAFPENLNLASQPDNTIDSTNDGKEVEESLSGVVLETTEDHDCVKTEIDDKVSFMGHILLQKPSFYSCFREALKDFEGDLFLGIEENGIGLKLKRNLAFQEHEQCLHLREFRETIFEKCFNSVIKHEQLSPLFEESYLDAELQRDFMREVEKVLTAKCNVSHESFHICEILNSEVAEREYLPNTFLMVQKKVNSCFFLSSIDMKSLLNEKINFKLQFKLNQDFDFFGLFQDFKVLRWMFRSSHAENSIDFHQIDQRFDFVGRVVDVCYVKAWVNHIRRSLKKTAIHAIGTVDLNEASGLIKSIVRSTGVGEDFYLKIENEKLGYIFAIDHEALNEVENRLALLWLTYVSVLMPAGPTVISYFRKYKQQILKKFPFVHLKLLNNDVEFKIQGDAISVESFIEFSKKIIARSITIDVAHEFNIKCLVLTKALAWSITIEGEECFVLYVYKMLKTLKENRKRDNAILFFNSEHTQKEKLIIPFKNTLLKILLELDVQNVIILKNKFAKHYRNYCMIEWSRVSNEVIVYRSTSSWITSVGGFYAFVMEHIRTNHTEHDMQLGLGNIVKENTGIYGKLIQKLQNLRFSLELEWGMKIPVVFEMLEYDVLKIVTDKHIKDGILQELMAPQKNRKVNFQTTCLFNGELVKRLLKDPIGDACDIQVVKGCVVFTGPYLYYLFFNIFFEEHLFSGNYTMPQCVYKIARFDDYAIVFQRSRKLFSEFKETLPEDIKDCRCEMRAFADELIIEPSLELIKKPGSGDLEKMYNKAFNRFVERKLKKKAIKICYGSLIQNDTDYNLLKHFVSVLNAEIRLIERLPYEPILVFALNRLDKEHNIVIVGSKDDVDFIATQLDQRHCVFRRIQTDNQRRQPIENVYKLFKAFKDKKHETRLIDFLFFRTYFDIRDNGLCQRLELDKTITALSNKDIFAELKKTLEPQDIELNVGQAYIETSRKTFVTVKETEAFFRSRIEKILKIDQHVIQFDTASVYNDHLESRLLYFIPAQSIVVENGHLRVESHNADLSVYRGKLEGSCDTVKSLGNDLLVTNVLQIERFVAFLQDIGQKLKEQKTGFIRIVEDSAQLAFELPRIDAYNVFCVIEDMLRCVETCLYELDYDTYEHIVRDVTVASRFDIHFEYCLGYMLVYSFNENSEFKKMIRQINNYISRKKRFFV